MTQNNIVQEKIFDTVYKTIENTANSNSFIQAISGLAGFPTTIAIDGVVIFTHYEPLINEIRAFYGRTKLDKTTVMPVIKSLLKEIFLDIAVDKFLGQVPVAGVYFNAICAKALTWRLGMLFTIVSSRGEEINYDNLSDVIKLVRAVNPQADMFKFIRPDYDIFKKIVLSVDGNDFNVYDEKIKKALAAFD